MTGTFFGLETALRALRSHQAAVDVINHNIANANTPGYSRQAAELATSAPYTVAAFNQPVDAGQLGTGVTVAAIRRSRDALLDAQYRSELSTSKQLDAGQSALERIEAAFDEPSSGLSGPLSEFFGAWQDLSSNPADSGARAILVQKSSALAQSFNHTASLLDAAQSDLNDQVAAATTDANDLGTEIAALNRQIVLVEGTGDRANDLRDKRDLALDKLAQLMGITTNENPDGSVDVSVGAHAFVTGTTVDTLTTTPTGPGGLWDVRFSSDAALVSPSSGEIRGLVNARDVTVPSYRSQLDTLASDLITAVNTLHTTGYGLDGVSGRPFFAGSDASNIAVDPAIAADPRRVGAADAAGQPANNTIALAIAQLRQTMSPPTEGAYAALVSALGGELQSTRTLADNESSLVQLLLLRQQKAYEAAARLMTALDQMLDKLINETGLVGR